MKRLFLLLFFITPFLSAKYLYMGHFIKCTLKNSQTPLQNQNREALFNFLQKEIPKMWQNLSGDPEVLLINDDPFLQNVLPRVMADKFDRPCFPSNDACTFWNEGKNSLVYTMNLYTDNFGNLSMFFNCIFEDKDAWINIECGLMEKFNPAQASRKIIELK